MQFTEAYYFEDTQHWMKNKIFLFLYDLNLCLLFTFT